MRATTELEVCIQNDFFGASPGYLRECVGKLKTALRGQRCQDSTLYHHLPLRNPRLANRIANLGSEQTRLAAEMDALVEAVGLLRDAPDQPLRQRMAELVEDLRRHEQDEIALLQSAYWRENGVGD